VTAAVKERTWDLATLLRRTKHNLASLARDAGVERGVLHRFENAGMSADEAEELCEAIGTDPGMVWDDWTGSAPAGNGKAPTGTPPPHWFGRTLPGAARSRPSNSTRPSRQRSRTGAASGRG
jgi:hypothetical protein